MPDPTRRPDPAPLDDPAFLARAAAYLDQTLSDADLQAFGTELETDESKRQAFALICLGDALAYEEFAPAVPVTIPSPPEEPPAKPAAPETTDSSAIPSGDGVPVAGDEPEIEVSAPTPAPPEAEPERRGWISSLLGRLSGGKK